MKSLFLNSKQLKAVFLFFTSFFLGFFLIISLNSCQFWKAEKIVFVDKVYDGDTFNDQKYRYRVFGIDTPELNSKTMIGLHYAKLAQQLVQKTILHKNVLIKHIKFDHYQRKVVKVIQNGQDVALMLLKKGYAITRYISIKPKDFFYSNDYEYYQKLLMIQYQAFKEKKGIWNNMEVFSKIFPNN